MPTALAETATDSTPCLASAMLCSIRSHAEVPSPRGRLVELGSTRLMPPPSRVFLNVWQQHQHGGALVPGPGPGLTWRARQTGAQAGRAGRGEHATGSALEEDDARIAKCGVPDVRREE